MEPSHLSAVKLERLNFRDLMEDFRSEKRAVQKEITERLEKGDDLAHVRKLAERIEKESSIRLIHF